MAPRRFLTLALVLAATLTALPALAQNDPAAREVEAAQKSAQQKLEKRDYDGVIAEWTKAMKAQPGNADWVYNRGLARMRKNDLAGAVADFTKAIDLKPDFASAYSGRARCRLWLGAQANAMVDLERAIALEPRNSVHIHDRAEFKLFQGNSQAALADNNAAVTLNAKSASNFIGRAITRQSLGDREGAIADFRQAKALSSDHRYIQLWLFATLRLNGQDGFADLARAATPWPDAWDRSVARYLLDSLSEKDFLALAEKAPNADARREQLCEAHYFVGATALAAGNAAKARTHFEKSVEQNVRSFVEDALARGELARLRSP